MVVPESCKLQPTKSLEGAIALGFRTNECSFEKRFENFAAAGAVVGAIGNLDDTLLQMVAKDSAEVALPAVLVNLESAVVLRRIVQLMQIGAAAGGGAAKVTMARVGDGMICGYTDPCPALTQEDVELYVDPVTKKREAAVAKKAASRFLTEKLHQGQNKPKEKMLHGRKFVKEAVDTGSTGTLHFWNGTAEASFK